MRTKTLLLSALLGTVGSISLMAQSTNVYSLNAVGYINVSLEPGYSIVSCPLIASPDNTLNTLMPNTNGQYKGFKVYFFTGGQGYNQIETGGKSTWLSGGTNTIEPGAAVYVLNPSNITVTATFVGTVPQGSLTNTLVSGYNLVGSIVPTSGDLVTNSITALTAAKGDRIYVNDPVNGYSSPGGIYTVGKSGFLTPPGNPIVPNVGEGFFYENNTGTNENWVENFSVSQ